MQIGQFAVDLEGENEEMKENLFYSLLQVQISSLILVSTHDDSAQIYMK